MDYNTYMQVMMMTEDMPKGSDMYKEGGLKCKSISRMEHMLDVEAKTKFKGDADASQENNI
jgi:hypothetical protein